MKYWEVGMTECGYGEKGILFKAHDSRPILSIRKVYEAVLITEECDGYHSRLLSKQEAIKALEEAIAWIKEDRDV